jgi:hypothetical protein
MTSIKRLKVVVAMIAITMFSGLQAEIVPTYRADIVATNFGLELASMGKVSAENGTVSFITTLFANNEPALYVYDISTLGFVIISAEDEVYPVLGWSLKGPFGGISEIPPAFEEWLKSYTDQIAFIRQEGLKGDQTIKAAWEQYSDISGNSLMGKPEATEVEPLLQSTWNQGTFYNLYCPADAMGPSGKALVGCVAVAMGQVLYYYRYPETGSGFSSYTHSNYGYLSAGYGSTTYLYNDMGRIATGKSHLAIAELLYHMGVSVQMNYGPSASGAYSHVAAQSLKSYFGYDQSLNLAYKYDYTDNNWVALLKANLDAGHPMYYHGYGSGGHAFNVDGYQNNTHFHFNWGWGGSYDGYFYLSNLNPGGQSFTSGQGAIVNFKPPASYYPTYCANNETVTGMAGTIEDGSGPIADYQNNANCTWLIKPTGLISHIDISFTRFSTEAGNDILFIYDGEDQTAPLLATISGDTIWPKITTSGNAAFIRFVTNSSSTAPGWLLSYEAYNPVFCTNLTMFTAAAGVFDDGSTAIHSYNDNTNCKYMIQPSGNNLIQLSFNYFSLEDGKDFLRIYDPTTIPTTLLGTFTGSSLPPDVIAGNGQMMLIFFSDNANGDLGWEVSYTSTVGINEPVIPSFSLYPNPASDKTTLDIPETISPQKISIYDITGRCVVSLNTPAEYAFPLTIHLHDLSEGVYMVRAGDLSRKLIIRR